MDALDDFVGLGGHPIRAARALEHRADDDQIEMGFLRAPGDFRDGLAGDGDEFGVNFFFFEQLQAAPERVENGVGVAGRFDDAEEGDLGIAGGGDERAEVRGLFRRFRAVAANQNFHEDAPFFICQGGRSGGRG